MHVVHLTTVPETLLFFERQISHLSKSGVTFEAISSRGAELTAFGHRCGIQTYGIPMSRQITPLQDLAALGRLWKAFRKSRPDVIQASTPKAALLGLTAGWLAGVPVKIFHVHGLPHVIAKGVKRLCLSASTMISCLLADRVFCVSQSMADLLPKSCAGNKSVVLGWGSPDGIDALTRFNPLLVSNSQREDFREILDIPQQAPVALFVGRLVSDKGINELVDAWQILLEECPDAYLAIAGKAEEHDPLPRDTWRKLQELPNLRLCGFLKDTTLAYAAADLLVLPSYREGLGVVLLEAAAMALPVVTTDVPGCVDGVMDGITGTLVPVKDASALASAVKRYLDNAELRMEHGQAGRAYILKHFQPEPIREQTIEEYTRLLTLARRRRYNAVKRILDFSVALMLLVLLSPALLCLALLIRLKLGSPVLFRQIRPGQYGHPFAMYKFRTMTDARDGDGNLLPDDQRLSRFGKFLRSTSLDELPELWNVLRGEMSLVGPRPLLMEYLERYSTFENRRHEVKPGITGWAQINGRNSLSWDNKFGLDVWYVEKSSLSVDLIILWRTLAAVFRRAGVAHEGHATMPLFLGTKKSICND